MNLEQLRKRAKDRLREERRTNPNAKLSGAQLAIAREHGFTSWPRMKAYVDRLAANQGSLQFAYHTDLAYYHDRAEGLLASAQDGTQTALELFENHAAPLTPEAARLVVARAHGFPSWQSLRRHVSGLVGAGSHSPWPTKR